MNVLRLLQDKPHPNMISMLFNSERITPNCPVRSSYAYPFVGMPMAPHGDMHSFMIRRRKNGHPPTLSVELCTDAARQLLGALHHLHTIIGWVHGDVSIENILVMCEPPELHICLCDMGLSRPMGTLRPTCGKKSYKSPEMLASEHVVASPQQDIFAFGVCVWAMLYGTLPFEEALSEDRRYCRMFIADQWRECLRSWSFSSKRIESPISHLIHRALHPDFWLKTAEECLTYL